MPHRRTRSQHRMATAAEEAELDHQIQPAAQQQAEREEEISGRLPRKVLRIQERMEVQQNSLDLLNNNISSLTALVTQLSVNMGAQPASTTAQMATSSPPTPEATPPHYQPILSPIPEGATPMNSSASSSGASRPLRFGNLFPRQLPHPDFRATSQFPPQAAIPPKSQPLAIPSSPTPPPIQTYQYTTPQTRPHYYTAPTTYTNPLVSNTTASSPITTATTTAPLLGSTTSLSSAPSISARVATQVFGEMPAQNSWLGTQGTTPSYYPGHEKPIKNSGVQSVSTSSGWQNLDEMPQQYDFHNLNRKSVFRADGTEQSYFALPENYPLQRAVPEPVRVVGNGETEDCSTQFVQVITGTPEKHGSTDPSLIDSEIGCKHEKAHTVDRRVSILNMLAPIQAKLQNISENLSWYPYLKRMETQGSKQPATSQPKHSTQEAIVLSDEMPLSDVYAAEDKGCSKDFVDVSASTPEQQPYEEDQRETEQPPKCFSRPNFSPERPIVGTVGVFSLTNESNNLLFAKQNIEQLLICSSTAPQCNTYEEESQGDEKILWEKPVCQTATGHSISFFPWDPGATAFSVLFPTVVDATKLQCTYVYNPELVHVLAENLGAQAAPIFASATVCYLACERGWTVVNASAELVLAVQISEATSVAKHALFLLSQDNSFSMQRAAHLSESLTWHGSLPGTPFLLLNITNYTWDPGVSKLKCAVQVQFVQQSTELSLFSLEFSTSSQKRVQWDPGVKVSLYCWFNILTVWREIATPFWQNQGISASYVWDPGTMLLWYKAKWWLLFTEEKISCHGDIKFNGIALWLITFNPP